MAAAMILASAAPASAFSMRKALQAVENLGQWSVMAQHCGALDSASNIRESILATIRDAGISPRQRQKLTKELQYWVKTINRNFRTGGLNVITACPIWENGGQQAVKKENHAAARRPQEPPWLRARPSPAGARDLPP